MRPNWQKMSSTRSVCTNLSRILCSQWISSQVLCYLIELSFQGRSIQTRKTIVAVTILTLIWSKLFSSEAWASLHSRIASKAWSLSKKGSSATLRVVLGKAAKIWTWFRRILIFNVSERRLANRVAMSKTRFYSQGQLAGWQCRDRCSQSCKIQICLILRPSRAWTRSHRLS